MEHRLEIPLKPVLQSLKNETAFTERELYGLRDEGQPILMGELDEDSIGTSVALERPTIFSMRKHL